MLSFMREQELGDSSVQKPPAAAGKISADSTEEPQEQEYLTVADQNKNVRKSTWLLAVFFGIGLLCLLFMIKKSTPKTATAAGVSTEETQIEMAITRLTGVRSEMFNRMDEIVKKFFEFSDVKQVNVNELAKNPFRHETFLGNLKKMSDTKEGDFDINADVMRRQAKHLQLLSIMQSAQGNCCMIDDRILYEGDSIRGFKVRQISDSFVKLEWNQNQSKSRERDPKRSKGRLGTQIILKLSE